VKIYSCKEEEDPVLDAWRGLKSFASTKNNAEFEEHVVTRREYMEEGGPRILNKFVL